MEIKRLLLLLVAMLMMSCNGGSGGDAAEQGALAEPEMSEASPAATETAVPTDPPAPTVTTAPTETPWPTSTPTRTPTPEPTATVDPVQIAELLAQAGEAYSLGHYQKAAEIYSEVIQLEPTDPHFYLLRADSHAGLSDYETAIADLLTAVDLGSDDPAAFNNLCWYYGLLEQAETAIPHCELAVDAEPSPMYLDSRGLVYAMLDDLDKSIGDFEVVLQGLADAMTPEEREIAAERRVWLEILRSGASPFVPEVLARLREGSLYEYAPLPEASAEQNDLLAALNHFWSGRIAFNDEEFAEAIDDFSMALDLYPEFAEAYYFRAIAYRFVGEPQNAVADYDQAITYEPGSSVSYYLRGLTQGTLENWQQAIRDYSEAIALNPDIPDYYISRGTAYLMQDQLASCIDDLDKAISLDPTNPWPLYVRGSCHSFAGNIEDAIADLEHAIEIGVSPDLEQTIEETLAELRS